MLAIKHVFVPVTQKKLEVGKAYLTLRCTRTAECAGQCGIGLHLTQVT